MTLQAFKANDEKEARVRDAFLLAFDPLGGSLDAFYSGAYECFVLGDVLFALKKSPIAGSITLEIFRKSFSAIHRLYTRPGTFEFYIEVFKAVWGDSVAVEFAVPAPGKLVINIEALNIQIDNLLARRVVNNEYVYDEIIDRGGNNLAAFGTAGIKTQDEAETLVTELYPAGLWVEVDLVIS